MRELVGDLRVQRQMLATSMPGTLVRMGRKSPRYSAGRVRLHVVGFHVRRTARQPHENDRGFQATLPSPSGRGAGGEGLQLPRNNARGTEAAGVEHRLEEMASNCGPGQIVGWVMGMPRIGYVEDGIGTDHAVSRRAIACSATVPSAKSTIA